MRARWSIVYTVRRGEERGKAFHLNTGYPDGYSTVYSASVYLLYIFYIIYEI